MTARRDRFAVITDAAIELVAELGMRGLTHRAVDARAGLPLGSTSAYFRTRKALVEAVVRRLVDLDRADLEATELPVELFDRMRRAEATKLAEAAGQADATGLPDGAGLPDGTGLPDGAGLADGAGLPDAAEPADGVAGGAGAGPAVPPVGGGPLGPPELDQLARGIAGVLDRWLTTGRTRTLARYACLLEATHHPELREILAHGVVFRAQARALLAQTGAADPERGGSHFVAYVDGLLFDRLVGAGSLSAPPPGSEQSRQDLYQAVRTVLFALAGAGASEIGAPDTGKP
ncbi:TetR/AcrR family transcriptional regulator [Plantactinospora endophytica]|uniref:HTH tetR-type domain-containing protein n=1 Tax=Plantactinospora endophytica TaxID=673535 RepID=A0ABQ4DWL4_9ACTN|nr:TetR/AcrR family transcriptional regulator [Plantactinospora endophytica]GIG86849.1 hypothetical protein Pen02_17850 [Plantactinospora endophytica]